MEPLDVKLLRRAIGRDRIHQSIRPLYGDRIWAEDLDIVNELGGHTGCVNALNWSMTGHLLASGSDDHHINIWDYNPTNLARPFSLNSSISTGHTGNIFSVKFMPYSGDHTVVSCAADSQVRVFDLEHSTSTSSVVNETASAQSRRFSSFFPTTRWLNEATTNAKIYRSHSDRAKRIVTESSPFVFLSCSEDGEVRQWDLRLPSSAYPPSCSMRRRNTRDSEQEEASSSPPPLISYKRYALDLNTISCSRSQPHYIALGGSHLHCFLHDRRMLGRDIGRERGHPSSRHSNTHSRDDNVMREATKCVKRFAPNNQSQMRSGNRGHITACKISDARPNELISSWSGDHIYSFDIIKSPDVSEAHPSRNPASKSVRLSNKSDRKRERQIVSERIRPVDIIQQRDHHHLVREQAALCVMYDDGAAESLSLNRPAPETVLSDAHVESQRIAQAVVQLRKTLFSSSLSTDENSNASTRNVSNSAKLHPDLLTNALGQASSLLVDMQDIMTSWSYPVNPSEEDVACQNTLRYDRQHGWRFVQAAGCMSRVLGGKLQTPSPAPDPRLSHFSHIKLAPREENSLAPASRFNLDFLKAILLWLDGGIAMLINGFQTPSGSRSHVRYPLGQDVSGLEVPIKLRDYLLGLANTEEAIIDISTSRFEQKERRILFHAQDVAVVAFTDMLSDTFIQTQTRLQQNVAQMKDNVDEKVFWGHKVGRALLLGAAEGVNYATMLRAFGGPEVSLMEESENLGHAPHVITDAEERVVTNVSIIGDPSSTSARPSSQISQRSMIDDDGEQFDTLVASTPSVVNCSSSEASNSLHDSPSDKGEDDNEHSEDESDDADSDSDSEPAHPLFRRNTSTGQLRDRASVNTHVPYTSHSMVYKGHCNIRTVKDVNYYGLDDEYVVSGSDDGHLFIWDRKTCQVVNILEGDGEIVNVVQGHPYEPMIACSGIDSTVKIFGPGVGSKERHDAACGRNIANPRGTIHSSLRHGGRSRRSGDTTAETDTSAGLSYGDDEEPVFNRDGLRSRRALGRRDEITSNNDDMRRRRDEEPVMTVRTDSLGSFNKIVVQRLASW